MIIKHVMEIYLDDDDLPTYASQIADEIEQDNYSVDDVESAILDLAYELDYDDSYWGGDYDEYADKLTTLIQDELNRRNEAISDN